MIDWLSAATILAAVAWLALLVLPWRPWSTRDRVVARPRTSSGDLSMLTVLIPARDEAAHIRATVEAVQAQGIGQRIIVIDDQSSDGTADQARAAGAEVIRGAPLPPGWTGKLWALEQGRRWADTPLILQLDADIELAPGLLASLMSLPASGRALVSVMALLPTDTLIQRLLLPAYVWFFMLLYPFRLANGVGERFAAAAGGCLLIRSQALVQLGGYAAIRGAVIDDCALAAAVKRQGGRIWIGLSRDVISRRGCQTLGQVRDLIARTAYTQLGHSATRLLALTVLMVWLFWLPLLPLLALPWAGLAALAGLVAWLAAALAYLPLLRFYRLSPLWGLALPVIAGLYLWMSWVSAWRHWRGRGAQWKGRHYGPPSAHRR